MNVDEINMEQKKYNIILMSGDNERTAMANIDLREADELEDRHSKYVCCTALHGIPTH